MEKLHQEHIRHSMKKINELHQVESSKKEMWKKSQPLIYLDHQRRDKLFKNQP